MKIKQYVYASFCEWSDNNVTYTLFDKKLTGSTVRENNYVFIQEIEIDCLSRDEVVALGVKEFDEKIFKLRIQIEAAENKKREMLALPMPEGE